MRYDDMKRECINKTFKTITLKLIILALVSLSLSACLPNNPGQSPKSGTKKSSPALSQTGSAPTALESTRFVVSSPSFTNDNVTLLFDTSQTKPAGAKLTSFCDQSGTTGKNQNANKSCNCRFTWNEVNKTNKRATQIPRSIQTLLSGVQDNLAICALPKAYKEEVPEGTTIEIQIIASETSSSSSQPRFIVTPYKHTKGQSQNEIFTNIHRYTCFEKISRGMKIKSKKSEPITATQEKTNGSLPTDQTSLSADALLATAFCLTKASANATSQGCEPADNNREISVQSYYYNLYTRSSTLGEINMENSRYICPLVKESLGFKRYENHTNYWPLDSSFALAPEKTNAYPIEVKAYTKIDTQSDNLILTNLGYAAQPLENGTCPKHTNEKGEIKPTYRLRRYVALYPPQYDTDGKLLPGPPGLDTIYVLDRPVVNITTAGRMEYTMLGPKPCPFAILDHKAVTANPDTSLPEDAANPPDYMSGLPRYLGVNNSAWDGPDKKGLNPDGIQFPNKDTVNSCAAAFPILDSNGVFKIATIHSTNPIYKRVWVRPTKSWTPHYEEDKDFLACAPTSTPALDPPIHLAKDRNGNISWCAEVYPTQNPLQAAAFKGNSKTPVAAFIPFTSHVKKNYYSYSPPCIATGTSSDRGYDLLAKHNSSTTHDSIPKLKENCSNGGTPDGANCNYSRYFTCDRTTVDQDYIKGTSKFPLLAPAKDIEKALQEDSSYNCTVTYDNAGPNSKAWKSTPQSGCCANNSIINMDDDKSTYQSYTAHIEPNDDGQVVCASAIYEY
jgi:hypothetical protein